jgi:glycosyltransferase involved in cell wall biosynthesis
MKISVAIPTYNSSKYLWKCIKPFINNDFIGEIIINDDSSNISEFGNICNIISNINSDKIKIYRNKSNQRAFVNKYFSVSKCSYDWVYLLDSDNFIDENTIDIFKSIDYSNDSICFCPKKLYLTNGKEIIFDYMHELIDLSITKDYINSNIPNINWFLNNGNFLVNKNNYIKSQKLYFKDSLNKDFINPNGCDVLLFSYYWFMNSFKYKIVDNFYYHHTIRDESYFMEDLDGNMGISYQYLNKILLL